MRPDEFNDSFYCFLAAPVPTPPLMFEAEGGSVALVDWIREPACEPSCRPRTYAERENGRSADCRRVDDAGMALTAALDRHVTELSLTSPLLRLTPSCEALAGFPNLRVLKLKSSALLRPFLRVGRPLAQLACLELSVTSSASILEDADVLGHDWA